MAVSRVGYCELSLACSSVTAKSSRFCYIVPMPTNLHRYYGAGYSHFITTSCYQRRPLLGTPRSRDLFLEVMEQAGGPLKPGFGLSGDVRTSQTWATEQTRLSSCHVDSRVFHHSGQSHFVTFCCYHPRRLFTRTQIDESSSQPGAVRRSFRLHVHGYVVMPEQLHLLLSEPQQRDTSSDRTAPLKPKAGLNGPPADEDLFGKLISLKNMRRLRLR